MRHVPAASSHGLHGSEPRDGHDGPAPIPRGYHHAPEGSSLRSLIGTVTDAIADADEWSIHFDEASGFPYYYNKVRLASPRSLWRHAATPLSLLL
jgi:hypothetical protein